MTVHFIYIHVKENKEMEVIIPVSSENKTTFLQIIPNGLFYCSNFVIQENGVTINYNNVYRRSYLQLSNKGKKLCFYSRIALKNYCFSKFYFKRK